MDINEGSFSSIDSYILICKYDKRKIPKTFFITIGYLDKNYNWFDNINNIINEKDGLISHWMPLPYMF